jgi:hypothetical protein
MVMNVSGGDTDSIFKVGKCIKCVNIGAIVRDGDPQHEPFRKPLWPIFV